MVRPLVRRTNSEASQSVTCSFLCLCPSLLSLCRWDRRAFLLASLLWSIWLALDLSLEIAGVLWKPCLSLWRCFQLPSVCPVWVVVHSSPVLTFSHRLLVERGRARRVVQVWDSKALLRALQGGEGLRALELVALVALEADRAVPAALRFPGELGGKPVAMCGG